MPKSRRHDYLALGLEGPSIVPGCVLFHLPPILPHPYENYPHGSRTKKGFHVHSQPYDHHPASSCFVSIYTQTLAELHIRYHSLTTRSTLVLSPCPPLLSVFLLVHIFFFVVVLQCPLERVPSSPFRPFPLQTQKIPHSQKITTVGEFTATASLHTLRPGIPVLPFFKSDPEQSVRAENNSSVIRKCVKKEKVPIDKERKKRIAEWWDSKKITLV